MVGITRWQHLWQDGTGVLPKEHWWRELQAHYTEPTRAYHTLQHVAECLDHLATVRAQLEHPVAVELALWFHDVIYDTHRSDNEEASAQWAQRLLQEVNVPVATITRVADLIRLTNHAAEPSDSDSAFLLDIDLAILGAEQARFAEYEEQVRQEYAWVAWPAFCTGRAKILRTFLQRPTIYRTPFFHDQFEAQAQANIAASLDKLVGFVQ